METWVAAEHARFGVPNGGLLSHVRCSSWGTCLHAVQSQMQEPSATQLSCLSTFSQVTCCALSAGCKPSLLGRAAQLHAACHICKEHTVAHMLLQLVLLHQSRGSPAMWKVLRVI